MADIDLNLDVGTSGAPGIVGLTTGQRDRILTVLGVTGTVQSIQTNIAALDVRVTNDEQALTNHLNDTVDAHDASAISISQIAILGSGVTNVQTALQDTNGRITTVNNALNTVINTTIPGLSTSNIAPSAVSNRQYSPFTHNNTGTTAPTTITFLGNSTLGSSGATTTINGDLDVSASRIRLTTTGAYLTSAAGANTGLLTSFGTLGTTAGSAIKLVSIGFTSANATSLGISALRKSNGSDWQSTAIGLTYDVDNDTAVNNQSIWLIANGNVGIGTDSPTVKLDVNGSTNVTGSLTVTSNSTISGNSSVTGNSYVNGNLGVGTTSPVVKLDVVGAIASSSTINASSTVTAGGNLIVRKASNPAIELANSDGSVWRNLTHNLTNGDFTISKSGLTLLTLTTDGALTVPSNITAYSDISLKTNIKVIDNALDKVNQIRGVTFNRVDVENKDQRFAGVIAQEIEKVLPEVVMQNSDGIKSIAYGNVVGLLIEAIKELNKKVDNLESQLANKE